MKHLLLSLLMCALLTGCCIHDLPGEPEPGPAPVPDTRAVLVHLVHDSDMPMLGEYDYANGALTSRSREDEEAAHQIRYTIKAYSESRGQTSRTESASAIFTAPISAGLDTTFSVNVPLGDYTLVAWTDYVDANSTADKYYTTDDFSEVILSTPGKHSGSNSHRDAFYGSGSTADAAIDADGVENVTIALERPLARYTFVTTDLQKFIEKIEKETVAAAERSGSRAPKLEDYTVKFVYPRYMTCSFNLFTGHPADSWTGVTFDTTMRRLNDDEAELGFDYVFVNGQPTAATVGLEVYDSNNTVIARIPAFNVPLQRSRHTIVRGEFLSTTAGGSTMIDPDFSGSFDIEIK